MLSAAEVGLPLRVRWYEQRREIFGDVNEEGSAMAESIKSMGESQNRINIHEYCPDPNRIEAVWVLLP